MSESTFKSIRNGAIATVVGGVILMLIPAVREYVVAAFSALWTAILWCWNAMTANYSAPGWLWLIIAGFATVGVARVYLTVRGNAKSPEHLSYVEDFLYGAKWRWQWRDDEIWNLWCFCPTCDATLVYDDSSCRGFSSDIRKTDFICENCERVVASVKGGSRDYATDAATREIHRRIRTGEYKRH